MSALSEARERREAVETFRDCMPWFGIQCVQNGKFASKGYDTDRAYGTVTHYFNEMRSYIKRDTALCDELEVKLRLAYEAFKLKDDKLGDAICDEIWRMPELKKIR